MSRDLAGQRCFNHAAREAVARCPGCRQFFCRECITEYEDRVMCASCLRRLARVPPLKRRGWVNACAFGRGLLGLLAAWFFFHLAGESLLSLPTSFHEGTFWQVGRWHEK